MYRRMDPRLIALLFRPGERKSRREARRGLVVVGAIVSACAGLQLFGHFVSVSPQMIHRPDKGHCLICDQSGLGVGVKVPGAQRTIRL